MSISHFRKYFFTTSFFLMLIGNICAQNPGYTVENISLPTELRDPNNQFSGLQVLNGSLYFLAESRLHEKQEAKMYAVPLADIELHRADSSHPLPYKKHPIIGLDILRNKMTAKGQSYEGLEACILDGANVYLSVETNTPSPFCYLLKGQFLGDDIILDTNIMLPVRKPVKPSGERIYNAGFEAVQLYKNKLYAFFEYNYFDKSYVYTFDNNLNANSLDSVKMDKLPFRITDITQTGKKSFTAINFFYKGEGEDSVYRVKPDDKNYTLTRDSSGFASYCRLITLKKKGKGFSWKPLWDFPASYMPFNWEGVAAYNDGYFLMNDKYTTARPYYSALLYVKKL